MKGFGKLLDRLAGIKPSAVWYAQPVVGALCVAGIFGGYTSPDRGFAGNHFVLWQSTQADAQNMAMQWIQKNVPPGDTIVTDNYMWTDLHDGYHGTVIFPRAHYYWKVDEDPAIRNKVFHGTWRTVDYVISTIQLQVDSHNSQLKLVLGAIAHATPVKHFDTGGWPIDIYKVNRGTPARLRAAKAVHAAKSPRYWFGTCVSTCAQPRSRPAPGSSAPRLVSADAPLHGSSGKQHRGASYWYGACIQQCAG